MAGRGVSTFDQTINLDGHDNSELTRAILPRTEEKYDRALRRFDKFLALHPTAVSPPDIRSYKGFLEFVAKNMKGRLGSKETPTVETVDGFRRDFEAGLLLRRGYNMPENVSTTVREWIKQGLKEKAGLCEEEMEKDGLSPNDLTILMTQLWCRDFKEYRGTCPDRTRVQLSAAILLYCFTSARSGEVHESTARRDLSRKQKHEGKDEIMGAHAIAACYKHFILTIELVDGVRMLVLTYSRVYVKGYWMKKRWELPIHAFYEIYREELPLFFNFLTFFIPMASADKAFCDYESAQDILDAVESIECGPEEKVIATIEFKPEVLDVPVFRPYDEQDIKLSTGRSRGADAFGKEFAELGHRSGYTRNVTGRACRRWALMEADKNHSVAARMKYAGHIRQDTFGRSYAHPLSEVDGPATYLGVSTRHEHIQNRRSMGMYRHPQLWQSLPAKAEFEFQERSDIISLDNSMQQLSKQLVSLQSPEERRQIQLQQHRIYNQKQSLYLEELRRIQKAQPRRSTIQPGTIREQTFFHYVRRVMPERDRLAQILPLSGTLRSDTGREAFKALEVLCTCESSVAYRCGMRHVDGKCVCGMLIQSESCHAEYCFECDLWIQSVQEWSYHCQRHLDKPEDLLRCDLIIFRNTPAKAAYCPFCLGDKFLKPSKRMAQFLDRPAWFSHVGSHLSPKALDGKFHCRHPACALELGSLPELEYHLKDVHCYTAPRGKKRDWAKCL
ncbi:uncharacterized protein NFIA_005060 [Aspergillus fischeri NRRL 181]|uniref:C2H2-type domain-containing protein n=1 Tax=Neosartorya fischeri (strain ATCC 1020 / DSM 3700 / CBS 544.65 / FGSC A1164 / JCM 1740 / NRRL 181 / WB 181) TaxID=331117 RepID=A1DKA5_NEOFI|nr:conserved hypothetical protein [Aspergillus fischeri NRRL 181]EAW17144.1 conserved hypothetical protein [Aspergillus fischeri NRRL 181]